MSVSDQKQAKRERRIREQILAHKAAILSWILGPPHTIPPTMSFQRQMDLIREYKRKNDEGVVDTHDYYEFMETSNRQLASLGRKTGEMGIYEFLTT